MFGFDVLGCRRGGRRYLLTFLTNPDVIQRILSHLGLESELTPRSRPPPEHVPDLATHS